MKATTKQILFACGFVSVGLGVVGMFLPLLPTTPFLLLAGICFVKSSKKAHAWLLANRWCGEYIRNYQEGKGMALKHKILSLSLLWLTIGYAALFIAEYVWLQLLLLIIAAGVTFHILKMNTYKPSVPDSSSKESIMIHTAGTILMQSENKS